MFDKNCMKIYLKILLVDKSGCKFFIFEFSHPCVLYFYTEKLFPKHFESMKS